MSLLLKRFRAALIHPSSRNPTFVPHSFIRPSLNHASPLHHFIQSTKYNPNPLSPTLPYLCSLCGSGFLHLNKFNAHTRHFGCILDQPLLPPQDLTNFLGSKLESTITMRFNADPTIRFDAFILSEVGKNLHLFETLTNTRARGLVVVIVSLPLRAVNLHKLLKRCKIASLFVHYEMDARVRTVLVDLARDRTCGVLVMTHLPERVDIDTIDLVIDFDTTYVMREPPFSTWTVKPLLNQFAPGSLTEVHHYHLPK